MIIDLPVHPTTQSRYLSTPSIFGVYRFQKFPVSHRKNHSFVYMTVLLCHVLNFLAIITLNYKSQNTAKPRLPSLFPRHPNRCAPLARAMDAKSLTNFILYKLNKICNGAVYTDPQYLNCLLLRFLRRVANYSPGIHSTIYIAIDPRIPLELKI